MIIKKAMANNTINIVQDPHTLSRSFKATLIISFLSKFSQHSSTNLPINFSLHLQFS